jgi:hypothetical protein
VLALGNQTLMNGAGQQGDAVPADLVAEVLAGEADGTRAGGAQDIHIQVVPFLCVGQGAGSSHGAKCKYACTRRGAWRGQVPLRAIQGTIGA